MIVGRGATNQKGPEATLLAALQAFRYAGRKLPVNLVFVAEGEEEIGSPHFKQIVHQPEVMAALRKCCRRVHAHGHAVAGWHSVHQPGRERRG